MNRTAILLLALLVCAPALPAQSSSWPTTHQQALWVNTSIDHAVSTRTALWFDGSWRRMGVGEEPQQLLLRPGVLFTIAPGVRIGGGYTYVATAPYGELPTATPFREQRTWQQLTLAHTAGPVSFLHRYRWEQRWLAPVIGEATGDFAYQQRARYMVRAQAPLAAFTYASRPVIWYVQEELLLPVGHDGAAGRFAQNRFLVGAGVPITPRQRLEVGYQNLWNALPARSANEINHTVTVGWVIMSGQ